MDKKDIKQLAMEIAGILDSKKADNIVIMDFEDKNDFTDFMVICDAESLTQVNALSKYVDNMMKDKGIKSYPQGNNVGNNNPWVLLDYVSIVVHIFQKETREFYNIEKLWSDAKIIEFSHENLNKM